MLEPAVLRQFIEAAKAGDVSAFERILFLHERQVLRTAQRLLLNRDDAQDAAQEVFLRLHRKLGQIRQDADLGPWLYRVTVNICLDMLRRSKRKGETADVETGGSALDPEQALARSEERQLLEMALQQLPDRERAAIVLRELEGCTTGEVAEILGSSETTVRSQISTGRAKMREFVNARRRERS